MPNFQLLDIYLISAFIGLLLGGLNSWYWYRNGYRGGKLFFLGVIAFFAISLIILKLFLD